MNIPFSISIFYFNYSFKNLYNIYKNNRLMSNKPFTPFVLDVVVPTIGGESFLKLSSLIFETILNAEGFSIL